MSDKNGEECWYALKVFYNRVFELEKQLSQEGVRSYIPLLHEDTVAGDKKIRKRKPAVSSLMFIRQSEHYLLELQDRMKASCPFMAYFDRETKKPAVIPDREMELFMQITSADTSDLEYFSDEAIDYRSGDKVRGHGRPVQGSRGVHQADPGQPPPGRRSGRHHRRSDDLHPGTFPGKNARKLTFAPRTMKVAR